MDPGHASEVKTAGHRNEYDFAALIGGEVNLGSHIDKKDVIDGQHRSHSVRPARFAGCSASVPNRVVECRAGGPP